MGYFADTRDDSIVGSLGCGPGCQCSPCRGLSESYVDDDTSGVGRVGWAGYAWPGLERVGAPAAVVATPTPLTAPALGTTTINVLLPGPGPGYDLYGDRNHQYGRADTVRALQTIAAAWQRAHPSGPTIGMGNISLFGGAPTPYHAAHRQGLEIDIRPMRRDGRNLPVTYQDPAYSRELTQELVSTIRANPILPIRVILFNDPMVRGVQQYPGHDNHLHVGFLASAASAPPTTRPTGQDVAFVRNAIARGERSANRLTDAVFYAHHPERRGRPITSVESERIAEWKSIRSGLVVPELSQALGPPQPSATGTVNGRR